MQNLAGLSYQKISALVKEWGESAFRAKQIFEGLYVHRYTDPDCFSTLSKTLRAMLLERYCIQYPKISECLMAQDQSSKHLFELEDGLQVEGVYMPLPDRSTLCISSQVGCAMGCTFCATGQLGLIRHLKAEEIVGQVMAMVISQNHPKDKPINLVFMGMGEPLHNLDAVMEAFETLTDARGLAIPPRRITLSTSGLVSGMERLAAYPKRPRLALSLNATTDEYRSRIMPVNRQWGMDALAEAIRRFPFGKGEKITLEYVLLKGVTDRLEDAKRLAQWTQGLPAKVNLIPFNEHEGAGFETPTEKAIEAFGKVLADHGVVVSIRRSRGRDIGGACGQLAGGV